MNQIFLQYLPFSIGGIIIGAGLWRICKTPWAHRMAGSIIALAFIHAGSIIALYRGRENMGESYAYLIYGALITILICTLAAILFIAWLAILVVNRKRENKRRLEQGVAPYSAQSALSGER